jgi:predicted N-formylglutamate amidohydrolase
LVIDCNRAVDEHDRCGGDGVPIPGNRAIDMQERQRRIERFYQPITMPSTKPWRTTTGRSLSIHSFTPALRAPRSLRRALRCRCCSTIIITRRSASGTALTATGLRVRYNEPYSALAGLIFSARSHGSRHGRQYLELELNNALLRTTSSIESIGNQVAGALERFLEEECASS